ncbi:hypothetical protein BKA80DRAFT_284805 [Phyllosticta citrichinensis]
MHRFSSFESLPVELSHLVCENLDFKDLKKLRPASRTMDAKATFTMEKAHQERFGSIHLPLTPSNLRALETFSERPLAKVVTALTLVKTDFETFVKDAKETAQSAGTSPWPAAMPPCRRGYKKRLYHEANKWTGTPLHTILPCLEYCHLIAPGPLNDYGPKASISEMVLWDFELIGALFGNFNRRLVLKLDAYGFFECQIRMNHDPSFSEVAFKAEQTSGLEMVAAPDLSALRFREQQEALQSYYQQIELHLWQRPIRTLLLWKMSLVLPHLQSIFQTASPPQELMLCSCMLDFDENLSRLPKLFQPVYCPSLDTALRNFTKRYDNTSLRPPKLCGPSDPTQRLRFVANKESIEAFVASPRPNLWKLAIAFCKTQPWTSHSSLGYLLEALKSCIYLELVEFMRIDDTLFNELDGPVDGSQLFNSIFREEELDWAAMVAEKGIVGTLDDAIRCVARVRAKWEPR